jgi:hypothetical protein
MKSLKLFGIMMLFASIIMVSCSDDDKATCTDGIKNQDETAIDCGGVCTACTSCTDGIQNGTETGIDCGGTCTACPTCSDGIQNGTETGIDCGGTCSECKEGVQGKWKSYPVAPILTTFADSIIAEFKTNSTYSVDQWKGGTKVNLTGTYVQTKSNVGAIYTIKINQSTPTVISAEGILEVSSDNKTMKYELLQTEPNLGFAPPTPAGGFGSTAGGAFGTTNIQNYVRIN